MCAAGRGSRPSWHTQEGCGCQKGFAPLLKVRGLPPALVWWRFTWVFFQFSSPGQAHQRISPSLQPWCPLLCPRGGAHERQLLFFLFLILSSYKTPWGVQLSHPSPSSGAWSEVAPALALLPGTAIPSRLWSSQIYIYICFLSFQENWGQTYFLL